MAPEPTTSAIFRALRSGTTTSLLKSAVESGSGPHVHSLHLATLFGFAVAQPLFDLIGRHPEFLVAQGIGTADLVAFALGLALALPLCGWGVLVLLDQLSAWLETATAVLSVGFLSGVLALQVFARTIPSPGLLLVTGAVGTGLGVIWAYFRFSGLRYFLTALSPSLFIFPAVFLLGSPGNQRTGIPEGPSAEQAAGLLTRRGRPHRGRCAKRLGSKSSLRRIRRESSGSTASTTRFAFSGLYGSGCAARRSG